MSLRTQIPVEIGIHGFLNISVWYCEYRRLCDNFIDYVSAFDRLQCLYLRFHTGLKDGFVPIDFKFIDHGIGVLVVGKGVVTGQEFIETLTEIYRSEETAKKLKYSLVDCTRLVSVDMSNSEIDMVVDMHERAVKITPDRVLSVAASGDLFYGLFRVWEGKMGNVSWEINIVRSWDEAHSWLKEKVKNKFGIDITMA